MTAATRTQLAEQALEKSLEVREEYGYDFRSPLCVYELADRAGVKVQFVDDVSMEGVYAALTRPTVLLSSLRPLARRAFTCAHELGHHVFGHGSTIDELRDNVESGTFSPIEFLADTFAGFILMPAGLDPVWWTSSERGIRCRPWRTRRAGGGGGASRMTTRRGRYDWSSMRARRSRPRRAIWA